jgi:hypothetical protein
MAASISLADRIRPHRQLMPAGIAKVKPAPAGKVEGRLRDRSSACLYGRGDGLQIGGIDDHQGPARRRCCATPEAAAQPAIDETRVIGAVVGKGPPEDRLVEPPRYRDISDGKLDVVDPAIVLASIHAALLWADSPRARPACGHP